MNKNIRLEVTDEVMMALVTTILVFFLNEFFIYPLVFFWWLLEHTWSSNLTNIAEKYTTQEYESG